MLRAGEVGDRGWEMARGTIDLMDMDLSRLWETVKDRESWGAAVCGS